LLEDQLEYDRERGDIAKKADEIVKTSLEEIQKGTSPLYTAMG
jgi:hypothetical protein